MDAVHITGTTRLYAVLGDPVRQVRAPALLNPVFARLGRDAVLVPVQVRPDGLPELIRALTAVGNLDGLLVTVPHKQTCRRLADSVTDAALSGSVNALRRRPGGGAVDDGARMD
ncbi:shikimate dehydrogenase family protein [Streptomyces canus]|uniref:shikimate dehydrogenase family protein n=1 Tax=Streptomyces canus TaxID=58343 RepID=UPI002E254632